MRVPISLVLHQQLLFSFFFIITSLVGVKQYLIVVLICTSLITNDVDHLFMWTIFWPFGEMKETRFIFSVLLFFEAFCSFMVL